MNIEKNLSTVEINQLQLELNELATLIRAVGRIEQLYLLTDRFVAKSKALFPESYCNSCPLTCCINDLYLPVTFLEWRAIKGFIDKSLSLDQKKIIQERLNGLDENLFSSPENALKNRHLYLNKTCPLLIDSKCSISPYRPFFCRTYGFFRKNLNNLPQKGEKDDLNEIVHACSLEINRWKFYLRLNHNKKLLPSFIGFFQEIIEHLNFKKPRKLLLVWLKEYFSENR